MAGYKVGDVFLQVTTNAVKAAEDLRDLTDMLAEQVGLYKEAEGAAKKLYEAQIDASKEQKNQNQRVLDGINEKIKKLDEERAALGALTKESEDRYKKEMGRLRKAADVAKLLATEQMRRDSAFSDYAGTIAEQRQRAGEEVAKKELQTIEGFLSRAMMQHNRYADRLDRRDMTSSVMENIRRGVQKGLLISERWHRDENALQKIARGFGIAGTAFDRVRSYSERAADAFYRLQRVGYILQTAISVLAGTLGALAGGLMALVGVAGQAAGALVAVGSAMASVVGGFIAARIGFGGIGRAVGQAWQQQRGYAGALRDTRRELRALKFDAEEAALSEEEAALALERAREELARVQDLPPDSRVRREVELQYQQAELAYRRAKARNEEVREDLKKGVADPASLIGGGGGQDPFADLTASQKKFAQYLVTLRPKLMELREASAAAFLPPLQNAVETVVSKVFPTLKVGLADLGGAMGRASETFANALASPDNLALLGKFFRNSVPVIEKFGDAMGSAFGGLLAILAAAQPLTERFTSWVADSAEKFEKWAKDGLESGSLTSFYNLAGDVASRLGAAFKSVFDGINNIMDAAFPGGDVTKGAGGVLLTWIGKITTGFEQFTSSSTFATWLEQTTRTATVALSTIGDFLGIMLDIAAEPELQQFWEIIRQAVDPIRSIFRDGVQASPAFARLFVSIANVLEVLSDSVALTIFMDTLALIFEIIEDMLTALKPFIEQIGRFHAAILAVTAVLFLFRKAGMVLFGVLEKMAMTLGGFGRTAFSATASLTAMKLRFGDLQRQTFVNTIGMTKMQAAVARSQAAMSNLGSSIWGIARAQAAAKNQQFLLSMAKAAGASKVELKALRLELDAAIRSGNTTIATMSRAAAATARASGNAAATAAIRRSGTVGSVTAPATPVNAGRIGGGAMGALSMTGLIGPIAGMIGMSMGGPISQVVGAIGMFGSMIPGIPGLVIGALGGLGSLVIGAIEGANLNAKLDPKVAEMRVSQQYIEKSTELGKSMMEAFVSAGVPTAVGAAAIDGIKSFAYTAGKTNTAAGAGLGREQITKIMQEVLSSGGPEIARILAAPGSDAAKAIMNNAVTAAINAGGTGKQLTSEQIASAATMAINAQQQGLTLEVYKIVGDTVLTGAEAQNAMLRQAADGFRTTMTDAAARVAEVQRVVNIDQNNYDVALRRLDAAANETAREQAQADVDRLKAILDTSNTHLATAQAQLDDAKGKFADAWKEQGGKLPLIADRLAGPLDIKPKSPFEIKPVSINTSANTVKWDSGSTSLLKNIEANTKNPPKVTVNSPQNTTNNYNSSLTAAQFTAFLKKIGSG